MLILNQRETFQCGWYIMLTVIMLRRPAKKQHRPKKQILEQLIMLGLMQPATEQFFDNKPFPCAVRHRISLVSDVICSMTRDG